jgi:signal transduction histidine kinase
MKAIAKLKFLLFLGGFTIMLWIILPSLSFGQGYSFYTPPDSVQLASARAAFKSNFSDTARMAACHELGYDYVGSKPDTSFYYYDQERVLARKLGLKLWEASALDLTGFLLLHKGNYPEAFQRFLAGIKISEDPTSEDTNWGLARFNTKKSPQIARLILLAQLRFDLSILYEKAGYSEKEFAELSIAEKVATENHDTSALGQINFGLGSYYLLHQIIDSAIIRLQNAVEFAKRSGFTFFEGESLNYLGKAYVSMGDDVSAQKYFRQSIAVNIENDSNFFLTQSFLSLANLFIKQGKTDSAFYYAREALALIKKNDLLGDKPQVYSSLSSVFQLRNNIDSAFKYQRLALAAGDSLNNAVKQFQNAGFAEQLRVRQIEEEGVVFQNKIRFYAMLAGLGVILLIAGILYRNNRQKQKANVVLAKTLSDLKATQSQLIQSEKMASLGELTAGIAHEIQNPLNFVNNFSEVNTELLAEMREQLKKGNLEEVERISDDLEANEHKILHHGGRADGIVKNMIQHARGTVGQKEPTNINALAEEYLRLSYHASRAKDKSFHAEIKTSFDDTIDKIEIIPQDIGRVLANLFNNAFYAVGEKAKQSLNGYEPNVSVSTRKNKGVVEISVKDNGIGIPENIRQKVFQPFFTTKPTGQGTGLGLSLSYDIIKAHGGEIKVRTNEGEGSEFIVTLV